MNAERLLFLKFTFRKIAVSALKSEAFKVLDQLVVVVGQGVVEEGVHRGVLLGQVLHEAVEGPHEVAREEVVAGALPVHEDCGVFCLDGVHYLLAQKVVYFGVPVNLFVIVKSVTEYII